ncbi:MAG: glycogen/starch/alpha-glucan phosphorylase, partial [Planctomycetota bacterium]
MSVAELTPQTDSTSNMDVETLKREIIRNLQYSVGKSLDDAEPQDLYTATALAVRQPLIDAMRETEQRYVKTNSKRVYYISMEFLMGKSLENNLINLRLLETCRKALVDLGVDLNLLMETEPDAGLGNGGLGRLAACFIDSIATLGIAGYGYGINYEYGLFKQEITNGWQIEKPDNWLQHGTPWQIERVGESVVVPLYGNVDFIEDRHGNTIPSWRNWQAIVGVPHDMPIVGFNGDTVNYLRLFSARGSHDFDMDVFNGGDYIRAVEGKIRGETISKVLYPSDAVMEGKELRLVQEYFMVACCIRDLVRRHEKQHDDIYSLSEFVAIQLNDTHPALAVAELMRLLLDERDMTWDDAWSITTNTLAYTNHTLLPEALEKWPVSLIERVLPRHLQIIFEINARFLDEVNRTWPDDVDRIRAMSIIEEVENGDNQVRMCNLAIVGSHSVNGVSALHSELVKSDLVPRFYDMMPEKFNNKTNGITPRRWLLQCNQPLSSLISSTIGEGWITDLDQLRALEEYAEDEEFQNAFRETKSIGKRELARIIKSSTGVTVDPNSMFDVQMKRIHQYKRQMLAAMRIAREYFAIVEDGYTPPCPRTYIFAGKAAPGYWAAKQIIGLINHIGRVVNHDPRANQWMKVVFLPNYRVSLAEKIFPAAELSEQISTAGFEASGTGNMKFMLNGALTMGTLDGANVEMREEAGADNFFIFGMTTEEVAMARFSGLSAQELLTQQPETQRFFEAVRGDRFIPGQNGAFGWAYDMLVENFDPYFHLADIESYCKVQ